MEKKVGLGPEPKNEGGEKIAGRLSILFGPFFLLQLFARPCLPYVFPVSL